MVNGRKENLTTDSKTEGQKRAEAGHCDDARRWLRVEMRTDRPNVHSARLVDDGALGVEMRDETTFMEDAFERSEDGSTRVIAYFEADQTVSQLRRHLTQSLTGAEVISVAEYGDRSWETAWMKYFEATSLSPRVAVGPPWDKPDESDGEVVLVIEPGMAFGTGTHETTRLCARLIDAIAKRRPLHSMIDVGCGSAILSMAAAGLGVQRVVAIDIDETAIEVAAENLDKNGFSAEAIELSTRRLEELEEPFDLVVANILANVLVDLRDELLEAVAPGGELILSGIAAEQRTDMCQIFDRADFELVEVEEDGEWIAIHLRRREDS